MHTISAAHQVAAASIPQGLLGAAIVFTVVLVSLAVLKRLLRR